MKQTLDLDVMSSRPEAVALYVYPGDFERRGLSPNYAGTSYDALAGAETQYVIGGARVVWASGGHTGTGIDREARVTIGLTDLIQSTSATIDLVTGELVETNNYYANGARESYRASSAGDRVAPDPMGFTGKEADEEVGLTYFGQRYLMTHLGRWASPDPLQTHAVGGGEALNGYHYVAGNVLQARDPQGLEVQMEVGDSQRPNTSENSMYDAGVELAMEYERNAREYFGIETVVRHRTDDDRASGRITIALEGEDDETLRDAARERASANLASLYGLGSDDYSAGMEAWDNERMRLLEDLRAGTVRAITLTNRDPRGGIMSSAVADGDTVILNPFHYTKLRGTGGAEVSRGFFFDYQHERDHQSGCLVGGAARCLSTPWTESEEGPTTLDIDRLLDASGLPARGTYEGSSIDRGTTGRIGRPGERTGTVTAPGEATLHGPVVGW